MRPTFVTTLTIAFIAGVVGQATADEKPQPLPIELFTRYDEFNSPKLSPDGQHIAYLTGKYGRSAVAIINTADRKLVGGVRCPDGNEVYDFVWKSNSRIVYQLAERQLGRAQPTPTGEMEAIDFDGKSQSVVYGYRAGQMQTGTNIKVRQASYASAEVI